MYHSHFALDEQAFSIAVNPRYLYMSAQHKEAFAHLLYGVNSGGFVMLSGEVGTGKTTIIRCLLEQLPETADLAVIMNPSATARDLICSICDEFGVGYAANETSIKSLTDALSAFLIQNHSRERKSIVLIDEAQLLQVSTLEQVRLLTNLETNTQKLLQIILVGQPELNELLSRASLRQLSQRITARYHLRPLSKEETVTYIKHRLAVAGSPAGQMPFPAKVMSKIHLTSGGIPRLINVLCDRMLLGAYSKGASSVDLNTCRQATAEVMGESSTHQRRLSPPLYLTAAMLALLVIGVALGASFNLDLFKKSTVAPSPREIPTTITQVQKKPAHTAIKTAPFWVSDQDQAIESLLKVLSIPSSGKAYPCWSIAELGYRCESQTADNWQKFLEYDRPAVLTITTPSKNIAFVTLIGLNANTAWVKVAEQTLQIPLAQLGQLWTGEYVFVWQRPELYDSPVGVGSNNPMTAWIAQQFATLDQQPSPMTKDTFSGGLKKRVIIFQKKHRLIDDGVVGLLTLLKLNEELGVDVSLTSLEPTLQGAH